MSGQDIVVEVDTNISDTGYVSPMVPFQLDSTGAAGNEFFSMNVQQTGGYGWTLGIHRFTNWTDTGTENLTSLDGVSALGTPFKRSGDVTVEGDSAHCVAGYSGSSTSVSAIQYCKYTYTNTFSSVEDVTTNPDTIYWDVDCSVKQRSGGELVFVYQGAPENIKGTRYRRLFIARRTTGGSWTRDIAADDGGQVHYRLGLGMGYCSSAISPDSDRFAFVYTRDDGTSEIRIYTSGNSLQSGVDITGWTASNEYMSILWDDSNARFVVWKGSTYSANGTKTPSAFALATDADSPTISNINTVPWPTSTNIGGGVYIYGGNIYVVVNYTSVVNPPGSELVCSVDGGSNWFVVGGLNKTFSEVSASTSAGPTCFISTKFQKASNLTLETLVVFGYIGITSWMLCIPVCSERSRKISGHILGNKGPVLNTAAVMRAQF